MNTYRIKFKAEPLLSGVCDSLGWNTAGGVGQRAWPRYLLGARRVPVKPTSAPLSASLPRPSLTREVGSRVGRDQGRGNRRRGRSGSPRSAPLAGAGTRRDAPQAERRPIVPRGAHAQAAVPSLKPSAAAEPAGGRLWQPRAGRPCPQQRGQDGAEADPEGKESSRPRAPC